MLRVHQLSLYNKNCTIRWAGRWKGLERFQFET